jgi:DNA-binding NarL/FixJ family response regulator
MVANGHPSILIGDDHTLVAEAITNLLACEFNVIGVVADGRALVEAARQLEPDIVLADIAMPILNGLDSARRIKRILPQTKIIFLTMMNDPAIVDEAFRIGASAVVLKTMAYSELVRVIRKESSRRLHIAAQTRSRDDLEIGSTNAGLTDRQRDVLQLLAEGLSMKEAARVLNLTTRTVVFHKYRMMQRLGIRNDAELVHYAIDKHLLFVSKPIQIHTSTKDTRHCRDRERSLDAQGQTARAA